MQTFMYSERHKLFPNTVIISYPSRWGGSFKNDRRAWMAELNGVVLDYSTKRLLIKDAIKNNLPYVVLRVHKNGNATQQSVHLTGGQSDGNNGQEAVPTSR